MMTRDSRVYIVDRVLGGGSFLLESWLESFIYYFHFALLSSRFEYFTICRLVLGVW